MTSKLRVPAFIPLPRMASKQRVLDAIVKQYLDTLREEGAAPVTMSGYAWIIQTATDALRERGLETEPSRWTREEVNYIKNVVFGHQKNGVRRRHLAVLNTYLKAHGNAVIQEMRIRWPADERMDPDHLSPSQALEILDAAQGLERLVIHLELNLGLRRVEVLRLTTKSFKPFLLSVQGKGRGGGKWRNIPYHPDTPDELKAYHRLRDAEIAKARAKDPTVTVPDSLFVYERGGRLYPYQKTAMDNLVKRVSSRTGIPFSNHTLRRTYGRMLWEMNRRYPGTCPIETIAELMGHRDIRTTIMYLGINLDDMATAMSGLARFQEQLRGKKPLTSTILVRSGQSGI